MSTVGYAHGKSRAPCLVSTTRALALLHRHRQTCYALNTTNESKADLVDIAPEPLRSCASLDGPVTVRGCASSNLSSTRARSKGEGGIPAHNIMALSSKSRRDVLFVHLQPSTYANTTNSTQDFAFSSSDAKLLFPAATLLSPVLFGSCPRGRGFLSNAFQRRPRPHSRCAPPRSRPGAVLGGPQPPALAVGTPSHRADATLNRPCMQRG